MAEVKPVRIFISSAYRGLEDYRKAVRDALLRLGVVPVAREEFSARAISSIEVSQREIATADALVVIATPRDEWILDPEQVRKWPTSITWLEVEEAQKLAKPIFAFLADWPREGWEKGSPADDFRSWLEERFYFQRFTTPEDLASKVTTSILRWREERPQSDSGVDPLPALLSQLRGESRDGLRTAIAIAGPDQQVDSRHLFAGVLIEGAALSGTSSASTLLKDLEKQLGIPLLTEEQLLRLLELSPEFESHKFSSAPIPLSALSQEVRGILVAARAHAKTDLITFRHLLLALLAPQDAGPPLSIQTLLSQHFDLNRLRQQLFDYLQKTYGPGDSEYWRAVLFPAGLPLPTLPPRAGFIGDQPMGDDSLGIRDEVAALSAVLMAKDVEPPISVGLFGHWGTGKSFFMERMYEYIAGLARDSKEAAETAFCTEVVQIRFNAWHYMDSNLWASLVSQIFASLFEKLSDSEKRRSEERQKLLSNLTTARLMRKEAAAEVERAAQLTVAAEKAFQEARAQREEKDRSLRQQWENLKLLVGSDSDLKKEVEGAVQKLGVGKTVETLDELKEVAREAATLRGRLQALALSTFNSPGGVLRLFLLVLAVAAPFLVGAGVAWLVGKNQGGEAIQQAFARFAQIATLVGTVGAWLRSQLGRVSSVVNSLANAQRKLEEKAGEKRREEEKKAALELDHLRKEELAARSELQAAESRLTKAQEELREAYTARRLYRFIQERSSSEDYAKRLGIVGLVRKDFERLTQLVARRSTLGFKATSDQKAWKIENIDDEGIELRVGDLIQSVNGKAATEIQDLEAALRSPSPAKLSILRGEEKIKDLEFEIPPQLPIERIVLYIDDLDRCRPRRVVEVLEAVHLLLAFKLFVVVVGVDPRWLRRSLLRQYPSTLGRGGLADWEDEPATPQDYMEKIFQIPFALRPMEAGGYQSLVMKLAPVKKEKDGTGTWTPSSAGASSREGAATTSAATAEGGAASGAAGGGLASAQVSGAGPGGAASGTARPVHLNPPQLELDTTELELMKNLSFLFATPRTVKRFVNLYRLVRVRTSEQDLTGFLGGHGRPGRYPAVQVLLAVVSSYPGLAEELFRAMAEFSRQPQVPLWSDFVKELPNLKRKPGTDGRAWDTLCRGLEQITPHLPPQLDLKAFLESVPAVTRFSFSSGARLEV